MITKEKRQKKKNKKCFKRFQEIVDKCKCLRYNNICVVGSAELHIGRG